MNEIHKELLKVAGDMTASKERVKNMCYNSLSIEGSLFDSPY